MTSRKKFNIIYDRSFLFCKENLLQRETFLHYSFHSPRVASEVQELESLYKDELQII
jgi:hypothetical protein